MIRARALTQERLEEFAVFKKLLIATAALGCLGLAGFGALAWKPAIAPVARPAAGSFAPELVAKGEVLAGGGYCAACLLFRGVFMARFDLTE